MAEVGGIEPSGNPDHCVEIDSRQESNFIIPLTSRPQSFEAFDPKDSADSSDFSALGTDSSTVQGTPKTILNQRFRKRRKQLHPSKSLSIPADSTDASQCSSAASSPPHSMEERSTAPEPAVLEEIDEDKDASIEDSVIETPNSASPSKSADEEKSSTSRKKSKKSEVEILFSSMTTTDMAALYVRNRTEADGWYSPRKTSTSTAASFAGSTITMTPTRTAAAVSKVINEVNLASVPRGKAKHRVPGPTVNLPKVSPATLRLRRPRSAAAAGPSDAGKQAKQTARPDKNTNVVAPQVRCERLTARGTSSLSSVDDDFMASSSRATGTRNGSSGRSQQLETVSTRHLPSAKSFKATFSFDETFCKYPPAITLKDGELVPVHTMAVPLHAKVPQDHYLRSWKINRRRNTDGNGSTTSAHPA